jgi:hypothetical protein
MAEFAFQAQAAEGSAKDSAARSRLDEDPDHRRRRAYRQDAGGVAPNSTGHASKLAGFMPKSGDGGAVLSKMRRESFELDNEYVKVAHIAR